MRDEAFVDLFAGVGGWDQGAKDLGLTGIGLELMFDACQTRRLNGLGNGTIQGDVRFWKASDERVAGIARTHGGLIASPPCQTFSIGGTKVGAHIVPAIMRALDEVARDEPGTGCLDIAENWKMDSETALILEPMRWVRDAEEFGGYGWVVMEQVPGAAGVYAEYARILQEYWGFNTWIGVLEATDYGVAQNRQRVVMIAKKQGAAQTPETRWKSMAAGGMTRAVEGAGLGVWDAQDLIGFPRKDDGRDSGIEVRVEGELRRYRRRDLRYAYQAAHTVTHKSRSWHRMLWHEKESKRYTTRTPVTIQEIGAIQSFPAGWQWGGSRTSQFLQAANAVPPRMAEAIIREALTPRSDPR